MKVTKEKRMTQNNKRGGKAKRLKKAFINFSAYLIYNIIIIIVLLSGILVAVGTIGLIVNGLTSCKVYCICFVIVTGFICFKWLIKEII